MKKILGSIAALVVATGAHAQLLSESTTGTALITSPSTYDVYFTLTSLNGGLPFSGGGTLTFTLAASADVTFSGYTSSPFAVGMLSGPGLTPIAVWYNTSADTTTLDLPKNTYTYTAFGLAFGPSNVYADVSAVSAVPEPQTYGMLLAGLAVVGVGLRRRRMSIV